MSVRGVEFVVPPKARRCELCTIFCWDNEEMVKQFCRCGCTTVFTCLNCPIDGAAELFDGRRKCEKLREEEEEEN